MPKVVRKKVRPTRGVTISPDVVRKRIFAGASTLKKLRNDSKVLSEKASDVQAALMDLCNEIGFTKDAVVDKDGNWLTVTIVQPESAVIDEEEFLKELTPDQRAAVMKEVLDHKMIENAIARGVIDAEVLERHTTIVPRTPFIKVT